MDGEEDKQKPPEGEGKVKRKMKTASQLDILEKTYAMETYPSEALRAELSGKLGLSDRQLQMWFCHRRLKDRKPPPAKRPRKDAAPAAAGGLSDGAGNGDELGAIGEVGNELASGSGSGSSPFAHVDLQNRIVVPRIGADMPAMKRYYEPPQAISELRAIAFVEAQLGEPLREEGPILGMEFDPLPPGAFGAPIVAATAQQKSIGRQYETQLYEHPDTKPLKGSTRAVHEYQFLPEQPSARNDTYERAMLSHYYGSPTHVPSARTPLSAGRLFAHGNEQSPSGYGFPGPLPSLSLLPQQGRQGHLLPSTSADLDNVTRKISFPSVGVDAHLAAHSIAGMESPFITSDKQVTHEDENLRIERKRKSDEARIAREVEAHEKRIRKEIEKQDILRRKREEQMRKEMERQDRERRKEEERLLREKQREEERYQREQRRELERREKFLQKESIRAEKLRLKEEMRREKEAARLKAANARATARKIAKESMELIDDERIELMDIAASRKGLPSILSLDTETLQNLELFRDMFTEFPPKSVCLKKPFSVQPWTDSEENTGNLLMVWRFLITFADVLGIWPFTMDEFVQAFHDYDPRLLAEIHMALLRSIIKDIEDVARTPSSGLGTNQNSAVNPGGGHPQIVEGAYAWGFDIRSWQRHLNPLTWPEVLRQFALSAGFGPKLKKWNMEQTYSRDENEGNDGEDVILNLRNGVAVENALAIMQERGFSNPRKSRHRLTPGTVKYAAFNVLSLEGSKGLTILEVAEKIQKSGLRDLTTSKTPEASIAAALSRDSKLFERTAPSTYCVRAPYRKDPADAEALLSAAREKVQVYKSGILDEEEAEDVERDEVERDEDSETDGAEDLEVDDIGTESKPSSEAIVSCETNDFQSKISSGNGNEILRKVIEPSPDQIAEVRSGLTSMQSEDLKVANGLIAFDKSVDAAVIRDKATIPFQENTVIDESFSGEPWVQGLMEGEYSDLSVDERLNALVALIGVANEGNSIRIVLEDRLEAANVLKKQMWAEAQVDKRRVKEDYVMKIPSSFICSRAEQNLSTCAVEGTQSPFIVDEKNDLQSIKFGIKNDPLGDPQIKQELHNSMPAEKSSSVHELSVGPDNIPFQQAGYAAEKSRSQLKAFIGHKAEGMYVYRSLPLGQDRRRNRYWQFITSSSQNDPGSGRIFVQLRDDRWRLIDSEKDFDALLASLDVRGVRESQLLSMLQMIEMSFRETIRKNSSAGNWQNIEDTSKAEIPELALKHDCVSTDSSNSGICSSNYDMSVTSSSFNIELGRSEIEKKHALKRYWDFEKWMWDECISSSVLRAMKHGKTRSKNLFGVCNSCRSLCLFESNHCPCKRSFDVSTANNFHEHVPRKEKSEGEAECTSQNKESSRPVRINLLMAQLSLVEASIPVEALQPVWSDDYRKSWALKLQHATSPEDLIQILTLLEGSIKRDFLLSDYETTSELLVSIDSTVCKAHSDLIPEVVSVLPWLPQTTASIALRLLELDSSIFYSLSQKEEAQSVRGVSELMTLPSKIAVAKIGSEAEVAEASHEASYLNQEPWIKPANGQMSSGQGRRGRGRGRTRGGRFQKRVIGARSEADPKSGRRNSDGFKQLLGWKGGQARGQGGRKRGRRSVGRRSARNRQKPVSGLTGIPAERDDNTKNAIFHGTPSTSALNWNPEETPIQVESPEKTSSSDFQSEDDNDNGQASGDEYSDLMVDHYPAVYNDKSEHLRQVNYGGVRDEDYDDRVEEDDEDDVDGDDVVEDEQEDVDVEGYFNGYSDEEGNLDMSGKQVGNADDITESSSSGYSN